MRFPYLLAGFISGSVSAMSEVEPPAVEIGHSDIQQEAQQSPLMNNNAITANFESYATAGNQLSIWQGMKHEWKRFIVDPVNGRIPHRISTYENYLVPDTGADNLVFRMGQNTGVDGNYMYPTSRALTVNTQGLDVAQASLNLQWRDEVSGGEVPIANNRIEYPIELANQPWREGSSAVFLQGFSLKTACDRSDASNGCNSDGLWPYLYNVSIQNCQASEYAGTRCTLAVDIFRAWTPNKGGFQLIGEVKPLNTKLDYDLTVYIAGLSGDSANIATKVKSIAKYQNALQEPDANPQNILMSSMGNNANYDQGLAAITAFGFVLTPADDINAGWKMLGSDVRQRGRYIARQQFEIVNSQYDAQNNMLDVNIDMNMWAPNTVVNSNFTTEMQLQLIELSGANRLNAKTAVEGKICLNSKDEAPFFSAWNKCDKQTKAAIEKFGGVEQETVEITTKPGVNQ